MQIVRDLGGYTLGLSDLLRRAMSKKKASVMEKERQNFVYGNEEENVPGCIKNGIQEKTANKIYDEMIDFAKYAFNKSHAAAYAVVAYQTAYLKYYYPVEFMAALMTSVIDNSSKVSEYIYSCRNMGIEILPPDVNRGESNFSVDEGKIRYGLSAIKSIGRPVIASLVQEREQNGSFQSLSDFVERMVTRDMNKRAIENLIKAGALDTLEGNRKQMMLTYGRVVDSVNQEKKTSMEGQMSLFDFADEQTKKEFEISLPDVEEYEKEILLGFEKEVLGVYISGHPMEDVEAVLKKNVTAATIDFYLDEEGKTKVEDGQSVTIGGMITNITQKVTRTNQLMAFITIEDMLGVTEVLLFPKTYEKCREHLREENKVFVRGRVNVNETENGKLIADYMVEFSSIPNELWLKFSNKEAYFQLEDEVLKELEQWDGQDNIVIYLEEERQKKILPRNRNVIASPQLVEHLEEILGKNNVKVVAKTIEKLWKMN